jgi:hypothetical protein
MDGSADKFFKAAQIAYGEAWDSQNDEDSEVAIDTMIASLSGITEQNYDYAKKLIGSFNVDEMPERAEAIDKALEENENLRKYLLLQFRNESKEATAASRSGEFQGNVINRYNLARLDRIGQHLHLAN